MWISEDSRIHTVSLVEPADVFAADTFEDFLELVDRDADAVEELLDSLEDTCIEQVSSNAADPDVEAVFEARHAPSGQVTGRLDTLEDLERSLAAVDERWRLDVLAAALEIVYAVSDD